MVNPFSRFKDDDWTPRAKLSLFACDLKTYKEERHANRNLEHTLAEEKEQLEIDHHFTGKEYTEDEARKIRDDCIKLEKRFREKTYARVMEAKMMNITLVIAIFAAVICVICYVKIDKSLDLPTIVLQYICAIFLSCVGAWAFTTLIFTRLFWYIAERKCLRNEKEADRFRRYHEQLTELYSLHD